MATLSINTDILSFDENKIFLTKELQRNEYLEIKKFLSDLEIFWDSAKHCFTGDSKIIKKVKENLLNGKKIISRKKDLHFYATPTIILDFIKDEFLNFGEYQFDNFNFLEPSAGEGNIADYYEKNFKNENITLIELFDINIEKLREKRYKNIIHTNFLEWNTNKTFDFIIMNPPFNKTEYIDHILKAYELLTPEFGELIAIFPSRIFEIPFNQLKKKEKELYELITKNQGSCIYGIFDKAFQGANIKVAVVKITKGYESKIRENLIKNIAVEIGSIYEFANKVEKAKSIKEIEEIITEFIEYKKENYQGSMPYPYSYMQDYISSVSSYFEKDFKLTLFDFI